VLLARDNGRHVTLWTVLGEHLDEQGLLRVQAVFGLIEDH
jgi:hypothetical protein